MTARKALLVGSMPFGSEEDSMRIAMETLGDTLLAMPDGEVGEKSDEFPAGRRQSWVHTAILANIDSGAFRVVREPAERTDKGFMKDQTTRWILKPNYPPAQLARHVDFGYLRYFRESYPLFKQLREQAGKPALPFQVGVPTGGAITLFSMSPLDGLRFRRAMDERLAHEVAEIVKEAGDDVIIQVEAPLEVLMAGYLPAFMVGLPVSWLTQLIERFPDGTRVGIHLCLGDLNNHTPARLNVEKMLVRLTNRLIATWPRGKRLDYVHFPLAEAATPPSTDPALYAPLRDVRLPEGARFVAGFVHEGLSEQEHGIILKAIEDARGHPVDVACSCGLARRTPEVARELLRLTAHTADLA
ncbi:MAG: hypothetical protein GYB64_00125 [Chloroflexi bacterium]|nr:hypothetical protein [Chloroflexota bacterium]